MQIIRCRAARLSVALIAAVAAVIPSSAAHASIQSTSLLGAYNIVNVGTERCLDAWSSDGGGNGNRVGLWDCNGGATEKWYVYLVDTSSEYNLMIINSRTGSRSLDYPAASGGAIGYEYELWNYANTTGQRFALQRRSAADNFYEISSQLGGISQVMDAFATDPHHGGNGNVVGNWTVTGNSLQHWWLIPVS